MRKNKKPVAPEIRKTREEVETFQPFHRAYIHVQPEPYCFNGMVGFRKWRIVAEEIPEPFSVLSERLLKLWRECNNCHQFGPLRAAAQEIGMELPSDQLGKDRP